MRDLVIVGCGGFGREVADLVDAINAEKPSWNLLGFVADGASALDIERSERRGLKVLGAVDSLPADASYVIGIGTGSVRQRIATRLDSLGHQAAEPLIHPGAFIGSDARLHNGVVICAGAVISTNVDIGAHSHVNWHSTVGHDSVLEDFVTVNPLVAVSGNCRIGRGANLGTHSCVLPGGIVGADAIVGGASCVVRPVAAGTTVKGVPAR